MTDATFGAALERLWPRAPKATIAAIEANAERIFNKFGIETSLEIAHFMAQISHECAAGTIVRENMNYRAERIVAVFGWDREKGRWRHSAKVTDAEAEQLAHHPEALAERVYGTGNPKKAKELGNEQPGDAFRCRGGGMLQLTGLGAYRKTGRKVGVDLENHPELLEDPVISFRVAVAEFVALGCLKPAAADDVREVSRLVNVGPGGAAASINGLNERAVWLRRWKDALEGTEEPVQRPRGAPEPPAKSIVQSKIAQGSVVAGIGTAIEVARQVGQAASEVSSAARDTADNAGAVMDVAHPLLASASLPWALLGLAVLGALGWVLLERYRKLQREGV